MLPLIPKSLSTGLGARVFVSGVLAAAGLTVGCQKVPLLAPTGSTITITASTTALPVNGTTQLVAQVIEASGTPPHSGTEITFTTTLGTIQPATAETDAGGRVIVTFNAGTANGTAVITALSGGASASGNNAIKIAIGTAAVGGVRVSASPAQVPALGGTSTISADVFDINGNALAGAPVVFTTSAGSLSASIVNTNVNGISTTVLSTSTQAIVTATVGATGATGATGGTGSTTPTTGQTSGTVTVSILNAPTLIITQPSSAPSEGLPATFTFAVTAATTGGAAIRDVTVNWGDGNATQDLGPVVGSQAISHTYRVAGTYTITATVTDASGQTNTYQTQVGVVVTSTPSVNVTPSVPSSCNSLSTSCTVTFTIQINPPPGVGVQQVTINYGDSAAGGGARDQVETKGGAVGTLTVTHTYFGHAQFPVTVTVLDTLNRNTTGSTVAVVP